MNPALEKRVAVILLLAAVLCQAVLLWPQLTAGRVPVNDNILHFELVQGMVQAVERGENPLDFWAPEYAGGFPIFRNYQPLAHGVVALIYFALLKSVPLMTVFLWVCYLSILAVPVAFFIMAILLELPPLTAAAAALLAPLIAAATGNPLGLELRSWLAHGVFAQCVATSLLVVTIGLLYQAIRKGRRPALAGALLGLTCLAHLMYGWAGALTACLLALMPDPEVPRRTRILRTVMAGSVAFVLAVFLLISILQDGYLLNHARVEPAEKWDSFGALKVLAWLFTGNVMDADRLPVLSLLAFGGAGLLLWDWRRTGKLAPAAAFLLLGSVFWLLVFFGRPTWGPLLLLLGVTADFHLHRVNAIVQVFLLMLAAIGLAAIWRELTRRVHPGASVVATALLLAPLVLEREHLIDTQLKLGAETLAAYESEQTALQGVVRLVKERGGRFSAGLPETWGYSFRVGNSTMAGILLTEQVPAVGFVFNTTGLPSDLRFDEMDPEYYRLYNVRSVVAPAVPGTPPFLRPIQDFGRIRVLDAPGGGYFDLVDVPAAARITRFDFFDVNDRWLHSDWDGKKQHLWLALKDDAPQQLPRVSARGALPPAQAAALSAGSVRNEKQSGQVYQAELDVVRPSFALFKMTWHPNWVAYVDGKPQKTAMLSPGFIGVPVTPGHHQILCRYEPGFWRLYLAMGGCLLVGLIVAVEWRRTPRIVESAPAAVAAPPASEPVARKKRNREKPSRL